MRDFFSSSPDPNLNCIHPSTDNIDRRLEFDESEIWNNYSNVVGHQFDQRVSPSPPSTKSHAIPIAAASRAKKPSSSWGKRKIVPDDAAASSSKTTAPSSSLPVSIPDWSKVMGQSQWRGSHEGYHCDEADVDEEDWVPPHEYAARQLTRRSGMVVAFSVHEGVGRTLKGRDLSRVRNAIWKQTGFED